MLDFWKIWKRESRKQYKVPRRRNVRREILIVKNLQFQLVNKSRVFYSKFGPFPQWVLLHHCLEKLAATKFVPEGIKKGLKPCRRSSKCLFLLLEGIWNLLLSFLDMFSILHYTCFLTQFVRELIVSVLVSPFVVCESFCRTRVWCEKLCKLHFSVIFLKSKFNKNGNNYKFFSC